MPTQTTPSAAKARSGKRRAPKPGAANAISDLVGSTPESDEAEAYRMDAERDKPKVAKERKPSLRTEAEAVLRESDGPMKVTELAEAAIARGNVKPKGKTPAATLAAICLRSTAFKKVAPATFDLAELNPRGAKHRPAQ